ncbi:hypothetical protein R3W88_009005 [Solanum pinnatisectum]|uniref:WRKY domain-containing protein n=1 Tax=Solanum pinnatisectum TaxID=50273 RepID=A0AAV9MCD1_9SOLN|nr:hypothetical protein R3W88_009005 [Solanum pinnatisectum]
MAENENDWGIWAAVRSCSKMNNSAHADHSVHEDPTHVNSALVDHSSVNEDGNSVNNTQDTTLFPEESNSVGDFRDAFAMENKRYFGLDEVISLANKLNTNSRIEPHNQENQTETIPNTPLEIVEHKEEEEEKENNAFIYRGKRTERYEILAEELGKADQWKWKKNTTSTTGKSYYSCSEVKKKCPAKRHVEQSSKDSTKLIVSYIGQHNHPPPNQHSNGTHET